MSRMRMAIDICDSTSEIVRGSNALRQIAQTKFDDDSKENKYKT